MTRAYLLVAGIVAVGLGGMILLAPVPFYASYGIDLAGQVNLLNEMRSHGLSLLVAGVFIGAGVFRQRLEPAAILVATALYLGYGLSRLVALALDGMPYSGLVMAGAAELVIGLAGLGLLLGSRRAQVV